MGKEFKPVVESRVPVGKAKEIVQVEVRLGLMMCEFEKFIECWKKGERHDESKWVVNVPYLIGMFDGYPASVFKKRDYEGNFEESSARWVVYFFHALLNAEWNVDHLPPERQKLRKDFVASWVDHFENMAMSPEMRAVWEAVKKGEQA